MAERVVIVGGGFGGLYAAQKLGGASSLEVTLVDRRNFHLFQPLLYQVATGGLSPGDIASPLRSVLKKYRNISVLQAEVVGLHAAERPLELADGAWLVGRPKTEADGRSAQAATAITESKPMGNLECPKDLDCAAVSLVDSVSLRYRLLLTSAPDSLVFAPSEAFFAMRVDSVADLQNIHTCSPENADYNVSAANIPADLQAQPVRRKRSFFSPR